MANIEKDSNDETTSEIAKLRSLLKDKENEIARLKKLIIGTGGEPPVSMHST